MNFDEMGLRSELVAALAKREITQPTAIQAAAFPVLLEGKSAYLSAETGTGKTLAYLLPLFSRLDPKLEATQLAIVAPTHELAIQIQRECCDLARDAGLAIRVLLLIGGTALDRQVEKLKKKPHVVVGSPGRVADLITMGKLKARALRAIVIDEADRLMSPEGLPVLRVIIQSAPRERQLVFASATEQAESGGAIAALEPHVVPIRTATAPVNANIEHLYLVCEGRDKPDLLRKLLHALKPERAMVFVHRNETADIVFAKLRFHHIEAVDLHAAGERQERKQAMEDFRSGRARVMIASDVAARGLDIKGVTHIFNIDAPTESRAYLHRTGRTARAGAAGHAVTLIAERDLRLVQRYERELGISMQRVIVREGRVQPADSGEPPLPGPDDPRSPGGAPPAAR